MSSVQDHLTMATGSKIEKRRHQQSFHAQVVHSTAPSLIIDGACARVILNPERSVQPAAALQQSQAGSARQGRGIEVRLAMYPARCGRATASAVK